MYRRLVSAILFCAVTALAQRRGGQNANVDEFRFRFVGPLAGNRVASVAAVPPPDPVEPPPPRPPKPPPPQSPPPLSQPLSLLSPLQSPQPLDESSPEQPSCSAP